MGPPSNADDLRPRDGLRALGWAAFVAFVALFAWEVTVRAWGFQPTRRESPRSWALTRARVDTDDPRAVVIAGSSRARYDFDLDQLQALTGRRPVQLALDDAEPDVILRHFAEDTTFRGIFIAVPYAHKVFFQPIKFDNARAKASLAAYESMQVHRLEFLEEYLHDLVDDHLAFRNPDASPQVATKAFVHLRAPRPSRARTTAERMGIEDDAFSPPGQLEWLHRLHTRMVKGPPAPADAVDRMLTAFEPLVEKIQARGGVVVFVALPTSGDVRTWLERRAPRKVFWDAFASRTSAITIHYQDPEFSKFECSDWSHLDRNAAPNFTREFTVALQAKLAARGAPTRRPSDERSR